MTETYDTSNIDLGICCPAEEAYHERLIESCIETVKRHQLQGIYLDQCGAAFGRRCYAEDHAHAPGGKGWNQGQRAMLTELRSRLAEVIGSRPLITTENAAEPLIGLVDGFLYYCGRPHETWGRPLPLWQAIYRGHAHNFADNFGKDWHGPNGGPSEVLLNKLALQGVLGNSLGWLPPQFLIDDFADAGTLMRNIRDARLPIRKHVREAMPVPAHLDTTGASGVFMGAWKYLEDYYVEDENLYCLAVNPRREAVDVTWPDGSRETLSPLGAGMHQSSL